jgi:hypothetical protein
LQRIRSIEHSVRTLVAQRVFGIALGYEDLNDHEALRHDTVFLVYRSASSRRVGGAVRHWRARAR